MHLRVYSREFSTWWWKTQLASLSWNLYFCRQTCTNYFDFCCFIQVCHFMKNLHDTFQVVAEYYTPVNIGNTETIILQLFHALPLNLKKKQKQKNPELKTYILSQPGVHNMLLFCKNHYLLVLKKCQLKEKIIKIFFLVLSRVCI